MAVWYVDSNNAGSPQDGLSWETAETTIQAGIDLAADGDDVWVASDHSENPSTTTTWTMGSVGSPIRVISVNSSTDAYEPATAKQFDLDGGVDLRINEYGVFHGLYIDINYQFYPVYNGAASDWYDCQFDLTGSGSSVLVVNHSSGAKVRFFDCDLLWTQQNTSHIITPIGDGILEWYGGSVGYSSPTSQPNSFIQGNSQSTSNILFSGVDLTTVENGLINEGLGNETTALFRGCNIKSTASHTGGSTSNAAFRSTILNTDDTTGNALYRYEVVTYFGDIFGDTDVYRDSGASDGTTPISWRMESSSVASESGFQLISDEITAWVKETGSRTFTLNCWWDSQTNIQDDEIWMELEYFGSSANTQYSKVHDGLATVLSTPADQTVNSETWTQPAGSPTTVQYPNEFQLNVTATIGRVGPVIARVYLAKPSTTVWVDPLLVVT